MRVDAAEPPKATDAPWLAPARAAAKQNPITSNQGTLAQGRQLFELGCLPCHGPSGRGDGPAAPSLERKPGDLSAAKMWEQTDGALFWKISEGRTPMPTFQETFSEEQRWLIVNYIRTLAPRGEARVAVAAQGSAVPAKTVQVTAQPVIVAPVPAVVKSPDASMPSQLITIPKDQFQKLLDEHQKLLQEMQEMRAFKAKLEQSVKQSETSKTETDQTISDLEKDIKDVKKMAKDSYPGTTKMLISGYASAGFNSQNNGGARGFYATFNPIFLWKMSDRLLFEGELEAELEGTGTKLSLEMAQISYVMNDYMTLGAGKFLNPMNYFVERQHMAWVNKLPDKPLAVYDGLLPETQVGVQLRGAVPFDSMKLGYAIYAANAPMLNVDPAATAVADFGRFEFNNFDNVGRHIAYGGRVGFLPIPELEFGYGAQYSEVAPPAGPGRVGALLHSVDASFVKDSAELRGTLNLKAQWVWSQVGSFTYDPGATVGGPFAFKNYRDGGYAQIAYRPSRLENEFIKNLEPVFRFDVLNQNSTLTGTDERRFTLGLNYWLGPSTVLKAAYEMDKQKGPNASPYDALLFQFATGF
ncbi:MAG: c-type cytochrome [Verrucomicrobia bacterium]|nr:c-type cytochrome [Verrucomicrobiota bacterium]